MKHQKSKYKPKPHIKMYANDEFIESLKKFAESEGLTLSAFVFLTMKNKIKRSK